MNIPFLTSAHNSLEAVAKCESDEFRPEPLDYSKPDVHGCLRPPMRQADRSIDWMRDSTEVIAERSARPTAPPGVLDTLFGKAYYLYRAHEEDRIKGAPGEILAQRHGAICRGTIDGAIWITHLKAKDHGPFAGIKLPALGAEAARDIGFLDEVFGQSIAVSGIILIDRSKL